MNKNIGTQKTNRELPNVSNKPESLVEIFDPQAMAILRSELLNGSLTNDVRQDAKLLTLFLTTRGYGVDPKEAQVAAIAIRSSGCSLEVLQDELARISIVM